MQIKFESLYTWDKPDDKPEPLDSPPEDPSLPDAYEPIPNRIPEPEPKDPDQKPC